MYLVAVNTEDFSERESVSLEDGQRVIFGRKPSSNASERQPTLLKLGWNDRLVSRSHCIGRRNGDDLILKRLPAMPGRSKPNAIYTNVPHRNRETCEEPVRLSPGDSVAIGAQGITSLYWVRKVSDIDELVLVYQDAVDKAHDAFEESPIRQQDYDEVEQLDEYSLRLQLKMIQQELPEQVLSGWTNEKDLFSKASVFLENALPGQRGVTVAFLTVTKEEGRVEFDILNEDPLARADFRPSRTLLKKINLIDPNPTDIYIWSSKDEKRVFTADSLGEQVDWVATLPLAQLDKTAKVYRDVNGRPVYLYVETRQASETAAASFIPFLRLICSLVASLLSARDEQRIQDRMSTYFSPGLRKLMRVSDQSQLEPAMVDCSIMFADRRGHSRILEMAKSDEEILERLEENQEVVGIITEEVFASNGVITDFAGDGALGLWGWPSFSESATEHARNAIEAAETIVHELEPWAEYEEEHGRKMAAVRIGISTGRLAVGKTGPSQQWHISVFGSVANLGARLERIAKEFALPVLISDDTYCRIDGLGEWRFRKLCFIRPVGFEESYPIYELVLPRKIGGSGATPGDVKLYEQALAPFAAREWDECIQMLEVLPEDDPASRWLKSKALAFRKDPPPPGWAGEVQSFTK